MVGHQRTGLSMVVLLNDTRVEMCGGFFRYFVAPPLFNVAQINKSIQSIQH